MVALESNFGYKCFVWIDSKSTIISFCFHCCCRHFKILLYLFLYKFVDFFYIGSCLFSVFHVTKRQCLMLIHVANIILITSGLCPYLPETQRTFCKHENKMVSSKVKILKYSQPYIQCANNNVKTS